MAWQIKYLRSVRKTVEKMDSQTRRRIHDYLENHIAKLTDPRQSGKPLKGQFSELWRYRIGNYRVMCELRDKEFIVLVVRIGHRKDVYQ